MTRALSSESSLDVLKREAKRWLHALRDTDAAVAAAARARLDRASPDAPAVPSLRHVQHALAREYGEAGWADLKRRVEELKRVAGIAAVTKPGTSSGPLGELLAASHAGDADRVRRVLDAYPVLLNERGTLAGHTGLRTALHFATVGPHVPVIALLLERGADPNIRDEGDNAYPLHFVAEKNHLESIRLLVEHGALTNGPGDDHLLDILGWATVFGKAEPDVVQYLIAHGARHNIWSAVAVGDVEAIRDIVARDPVVLSAQMDTTNARRRPLHLAVVKRQPASLAALLEAGADTALVDIAGLTALDQAALDAQQEMAQALIDAGATIELPAAVALGRHEDAARILAADRTLLWPGKKYGGLLARAAEHASGDVIEALIRGGANVNATVAPDQAVDGAHGYTPLHAAAFHGNMAAVEALLQAGADVRARDRKYAGTPAGWARHGNKPEAMALISAGDIDIFDAVDLDLVDRIAGIVARDPAVLSRRFGETVPWLKPGALDWLDPTYTPLDMARAWGRSRVVERLEALMSDREGLERAEIVVRFLRNAARDWRSGGGGEISMARATASRLLRQHAWLAHENILTAVVCGNVEAVREILAERGELANEAGGPRSWTPLLYLASTRLEQHEAAANSVEVARMLLEHGADPNAHYPGGHPSIHYTVLTCAMGHGEEQAPPHPRARELAALLMEHDAQPFDTQLFYNVFADHASRPHLTDDIVWLMELIHTHSVRRGMGDRWNDPSWSMIDMGGYGPGAFYLLDMAVKTGLVRFAEWCLQHGAGPNVRATNEQRSRKSLHEIAVREGRTEIAALLVEYGAGPSTVEFSSEERFAVACVMGDADTVRRLAREAPELLQVRAALYGAVKRDDAAMVELLLDLGASPDLEEEGNGRGRPLHTAAFSGASRAAAVLLARGADPDFRELNYGATPMGVANWAQQPAVADVIAVYSRDLFNLVFAGKIDRVRELLAEQPSLAASIHPDGDSILMWLPDDEAVALKLAELLLSYGADASLRDSRGVTAAEMARRRAMARVADVLSQAESAT